MSSEQREMQKLYIVGHPVAHSKSPAMYNAVYERLGLPWHYDFMDINGANEEEIANAALRFLQSENYLSVNITTPCKPQAFESADIKGASAQLAGGVNLIVQKNGHRLGYNVDGQGCVQFLERSGVNFADKCIVVCGTGPTALSILHSVAQCAPHEVLLLGRDKARVRATLEAYVEKYRELVSTAVMLPAADTNHYSFEEAYEKVEFKYGTYETSTKAISAADVIIDATILGMKEGDPAPFDTSLLHANQVVMDTVYGHGETALLKAAREAGCGVFDGAGMLVSQAALSATIVCEVEDVDLALSYDQLFDIMANAAGFFNISA